MTGRYIVRTAGEKLSKRSGWTVLEPGNTLVTGEDSLEWELTSLEQDLLVLASAIFAADRATQRGEREEFNSRTIELSVPVVNAARLSPLTTQLEQILRLLSCDSWQINFRGRAGTPESEPEFPEADGATLLFSGGLDSLAGAIKLLSDKIPTQLVSHVTNNPQTIQSQRGLVEILAAAGLKAPHRQIRVSSRDGAGLVHDVENSQRTRSFVFLVLAAVVARRTGLLDLVMMAENGLFAIHLPVGDARIGAFSTHTANPRYLALMQNFLSTCLATEVTISNPFLYMTKGEVTKIVVDALPAAVSHAVSCWRGARHSGGWHCGECIPCLMRRIAVERSSSPDPTHYGRDLLAEDISALGPEDTGRRNIVDLLEFIARVEACDDERMISAFPELLSAHFDHVEAIALYRRFAIEGRAVLDSYPHVRAIA